MLEQKDTSSKSDFFEKVFEIVKLIPKGKVSTYGAIGTAIGVRSSARMVGWALNSAAYRNDIPCHRVVNRNGDLTGKHYFAGPNVMREMLESEGIEFSEERVNLAKHLWIPDIS